MIVKTNKDRKLLLFSFLINRAGGDFLFYLRAWSNTLSCLIVKVYLWEWRFFHPFLKWECRNKIILWNFGNLILNLVGSQSRRQKLYESFKDTSLLNLFIILILFIYKLFLLTETAQRLTWCHIVTSLI